MIRQSGWSAAAAAAGILVLVALAVTLHSDYEIHQSKKGQTDSLLFNSSKSIHRLYEMNINF